MFIEWTLGCLEIKEHLAKDKLYDHILHCQMDAMQITTTHLLNAMIYSIGWIVYPVKDQGSIHIKSHSELSFLFHREKKSLNYFFHI